MDTQIRPATSKSIQLRVTGSNNVEKFVLAWWLGSRPPVPASNSLSSRWRTLPSAGVKWKEFAPFLILTTPLCLYGVCLMVIQLLSSNSGVLRFRNRATSFRSYEKIQCQTCSPSFLREPGYLPENKVVGSSHSFKDVKHRTSYSTSLRYTHLPRRFFERGRPEH